MQWDLGIQGIAYLVVMAACFGVLAGLVVGGDLTHRIWSLVVTTVACVVTGAVTSEVVFGWADEKDLQPNVDGLSRDEALLSSLLTTLVVVVAVRYLAHRHLATSSGGKHSVGGRHGRHVGHV
jgi:xanthine/uracil permease